MLLATSVVSPVSAVFAETGMDLTMEIKIMKSKRASQAKRELFELFSFCSESNSETGYPNYYSGGYIDDDNVFHACFSDTLNKHFDECYELLSKFGDSLVPYFIGLTAFPWFTLIENNDSLFEITNN